MLHIQRIGEEGNAAEFRKNTKKGDKKAEKS